MTDNRVKREAAEIEELVRTGTTQDSATSDRCFKEVAQELEQARREGYLPQLLNQLRDNQSTLNPWQPDFSVHTQGDNTFIEFDSPYFGTQGGNYHWSYCVKASTLAAPPTDKLPGETNLQTAWRQAGGNPDDMK